MSFLKSKHSGWTHELRRTPFGGGGGGGFIGDIGSDIGGAVSDVGSAVGNVVSQASDSVSNLFSQAGLGGSIATPQNLASLAALVGAPETGGATLALDAEAVAAADATAAGLGYSSAAEAISAGAATAENLGLPAATSIADLGAVQGSASAGYLGSVGGDIAGAGAGSITPEMVKAANATSDPIGALASMTGMSPQEIAAATGQGAQAGTSLGDILGYAKTGAQIIGGLGKAAGGIGALQAGKKVGQLQADPFAQYRPGLAAQLNQLLTSPQTVTQTPGYQFNLSQGLQGLQAQQAAQGRLVSGGALLQGQQYGQQLASQTYQQQLANLASLSGATQSPGTGATAQAGLYGGQLGGILGGAQAIAQGLGVATGQSPLDSLYANYNKSSPTQ